MKIKFEIEGANGTFLEEFDLILSPSHMEVILDNGYVLATYLCLVTENEDLYQENFIPTCNLSCDYISQSIAAYYDGIKYEIKNCDFTNDEGVLMVQLAML